MNSVILQLLFGAGCIAIGFFTGLSMGWREYRMGEKHFAAPTLPRTEKQQAYVLVVVAILSVVSSAYAGVQTAAQAECNQEFKDSLVARSAITAENQRHLNDMIDVIADSIQSPTPDARERTRKAILDYQRWSADAERLRAENPLRDPVCGGD